MFKTDTLDALSDSDLGSVIRHAEGLLKKRDGERKAQAMVEARAILAAAGLSMKDLTGKPKPKAKGVMYKNGHHYQHPTKKDMVWNGVGKKPNWLKDLEGSGEEAVEVPA